METKSSWYHPFMRYNQSLMGTLSSSQHPLKGYLLMRPGQKICRWRALVHSESGLEYCLQELPPGFDVTGLLAKNSQGKAAHEQGDWKTAEHCFLHCKEMVLRGGLEHLQRPSYHSLLAWADLFLVQLYQSVGSVDMLRKAVDLRKEMLDCVMPLRILEAPQLVEVCKTYYYTAQYELGEALVSSAVKNDAVQEYAKLLSCTEDAAEAQICFLLCLDHECLGRFDLSLRWFREAERVRNINCLNWTHLILGHEAKLLMKLEKFSDAIESLEHLPLEFESVPYIEREVHEMLQECYTQMSRRAADIQDFQRAEEYEYIARKYRRLARHTRIADYFDSWQFPTPRFGRLRRGLVLASGWSDSYLYFSKLPYEIHEIFRILMDTESGARESQNWMAATELSQQMREFLKMAKNLLDTEFYYWLLSRVDLSLAGLYHYHARNFEKALEIWKEIQECYAHRLASADKLEISSKDYQVPLAALEYEMSCSSTSVQGKSNEIIRNWARAYCTDAETAERDLCFWLYLGFHCYAKFEDALKWLQKAKSLKKEHGGLLSNGCCRRQRSFRIDYFCCVYDYNRCEIDLFTKLGRNEEAAIARESLLNTKHDQLDGLIDDVHYEKVEGIVQEELPTVSPTPTGCILLGRSNLPTAKLVQSPVGLEHHLLQLPLPIQLAFRKHAYLGRLYDQGSADWENAILQYELCREILVTAAESDRWFAKSRDWLMVWADLPLAEIYDRKQQYKKALELWMQMADLRRDSDRKLSEYLLFSRGLSTLELLRDTDQDIGRIAETQPSKDSILEVVMDENQVDSNVMEEKQTHGHSNSSTNNFSSDNDIGKGNDAPIDAFHNEIMKIDNISEVSSDHKDLQSLLHGEETIVFSCYDVQHNLFEFYFKDCEDMASIVGVGLQYAKAMLIEGWKIQIKEISKMGWEQTLDRVKLSSTTVYRSLKVGTCPPHLIDKEVDFKKHTGRPLLWDLAKYFTLKEAIETKELDIKCAGTGGASSSNPPPSSVRTANGYDGDDENEKFSILRTAFRKWWLEEGGDDDEGNHDHGEDPVGPSDAIDKYLDTTVSVEFLSGGNIEGAADLNSETKERLKSLDKTIEPSLEFTFMIQDEVKQVRTTVGYIGFNLGWNGFHEDGERWLHHSLKVAFGLSNSQFGVVQRGSYEHLDVKSGTENMKASHTVEKKHGKDNAWKGRLYGKPYGVGISGAKERTTRQDDGDSRQCESSVERSIDHTGGGLFPREFIDPDRCQIACEYKMFIHPKDMSEDFLPSSPMLNNQHVKFQGTWNVNESSPNFVEYLLMASRHIEERVPSQKENVNASGERHISRPRRSCNQNSEGSSQTKHKQIYKTKVLINHYMTHLDGKIHRLEELVRGGTRGTRYLAKYGRTAEYQWEKSPFVKLP